MVTCKQVVFVLVVCCLQAAGCLQEAYCHGVLSKVAYCLGHIVSSSVMSLVADSGGGILSRGILTRGVLTQGILSRGVMSLHQGYVTLS